MGGTEGKEHKAIGKSKCCTCVNKEDAHICSDIQMYSGTHEKQGGGKSGDAHTKIRFKTEIPTVHREVSKDSVGP